MTVKIKLTGEAWGEQGLIVGAKQDPIDPTRFEIISGDYAEYEVFVGDDLEEGYRANWSGELVSVPLSELGVGDKVRATYGESVLVGHVTRAQDHNGDVHIDIGGVDESWYLEEGDGWKVELLERPVPEVPIEEHTLFLSQNNGMIYRARDGKAECRSLAGGAEWAPSSIRLKTLHEDERFERLN